MTTTETREARKTRLLAMRETMTLGEIASLENVSRARIGQLLGPTRQTNPILLEIHAFICDYQRRNRKPPTIVEIARAFPTQAGKPRSTSVVTYWLDQMERLGMIEKRRADTRRDIFARKLPKSDAILEMQEQLKGKEDSHENKL